LTRFSCTHTLCSRDFGPLHTDLLQIPQVSGKSLGNTDFQLPPKTFYWVQVWRLARPLQELEMLLTVSIHLATHGPIHPLLNTVQFAFCKKSIPKELCFHLHASQCGWCSWSCTHPSSSSKHGEWSLDQKALFLSHQIR